MPDIDREDQPDSKRNYSLFTRLFSLESLTTEPDLSLRFHRIQEGDDPWLAFSLEGILQDDINEAKDLCEEEIIKDEDLENVMTELPPEPQKDYEPSMVDSAYGSQPSTFFSDNLTESLEQQSETMLIGDESKVNEDDSGVQLDEKVNEDDCGIVLDECNKDEVDLNKDESGVQLDESKSQEELEIDTSMDESALSSSQMFHSPNILSSTQVESTDTERTALPRILSCITIPPPLSSNEHDECIDSPDFIEPLQRSELPAHLKKALDVENGQSALLEETLRPLNITFTDRRSSMDNESGIGSSALSGEEKKNSFYDAVNNRIVGDLKLNLMDPMFKNSVKPPSQLTEREQSLLCPRVVLFDIFSFIHFKDGVHPNNEFNVLGRFSSCDSRSPSPMALPLLPLSALKTTVINSVVAAPKPRKIVVSFIRF